MPTSQQDHYLSKHRGRMPSATRVFLPMRARMDLSASRRTFHGVGGRRNAVQVRADILNFGNLLNNNWGSRLADAGGGEFQQPDSLLTRKPRRRPGTSPSTGCGGQQPADYPDVRVVERYFDGRVPSSVQPPLHVQLKSGRRPAAPGAATRNSPDPLRSGLFFGQASGPARFRPAPPGRRVEQAALVQLVVDPLDAGGQVVLVDLDADEIHAESERPRPRCCRGRGTDPSPA